MGTVKKTLTTVIATAAASMALVSGAYASCAANIDMGGYSITNTSMTVVPQAFSSEVATKSYVDNLMAGTNPILQLGELSQAALVSSGAATQFCSLVTGDSADRPWRLPTLDELMVALAVNNPNTTDTNFLWTRTPYNLSTAAPIELDGHSSDTARAISGGYWIAYRPSDGLWEHKIHTDTSIYARCVR